LKKLPYFVIAPPDEECIEAVREYLSGWIGRNRLRKICGKAFSNSSIYREYGFAIDIVVADGKWRGSAVRHKISSRTITIKSVKLPIWLAQKAEERAREEGVSFSEIVRRALMTYLS
jgi:hypothetical protein